MRRAYAIAAAILLTACGSGDTPPDVAPEGVDLPRAGLLGPLPPREGRVDVVIDGTGQLRVAGETVTLATLRPALRAASGGDLEARDEEIEETEVVDEELVEIPEEDVSPTPDEPGPGPRHEDALEPDGSRGADVLLRIDRAVPWAVVVQVLMAAAHPEVKLYRIWWGAQDDDGRHEGALACFLPKDRCCGGQEKLEPIQARVRFAAGEAPSDGRALHGALRAMRIRAPGSPLLVEAGFDARTPWHVVVGALDTALRSGAVQFVTAGLPRLDETKTPARWIAEARALPGVRLTVTNEWREPVEAEPHALPPARWQDTAIGLSNAFDYGMPEIELEELEAQLPEEGPAEDEGGR